MRHRRILRMMAGDTKSPSERFADRMARRDARMMAEFRRQKNDPELAPMPLNFAEIERRRKERQP
jgi:hypothetical protein